MFTPKSPNVPVPKTPLEAVADELGTPDSRQNESPGLLVQKSKAGVSPGSQSRKGVTTPKPQSTPGASVGAGTKAVAAPPANASPTAHGTSPTTPQPTASPNVGLQTPMPQPSKPVAPPSSSKQAGGVQSSPAVAVGQTQGSGPSQTPRAGPASGVKQAGNATGVATPTAVASAGKPPASAASAAPSPQARPAEYITPAAPQSHAQAQAGQTGTYSARAPASASSATRARSSDGAMVATISTVSHQGLVTPLTMPATPDAGPGALTSGITGQPASGPAAVTPTQPVLTPAAVAPAPSPGPAPVDYRAILRGEVPIEQPAEPSQTRPKAPLDPLAHDAKVAGVAHLLGPGKGVSSESADWRTSPEPLVRRLVSELARRTEALRTAGAEIVRLRRDLASSKASLTKEQEDRAVEHRTRQEADRAVLAAAVADIAAAARARQSALSLPSLLTASTSPHASSAGGPEGIAVELARGLRDADPSGETTVPLLLRRLVVLANQYGQARLANTWLQAEVHSLKAQVRMEQAAGAGRRTGHVGVLSPPLASESLSSAPPSSSSSPSRPPASHPKPVLSSVLTSALDATSVSGFVPTEGGVAGIAMSPGGQLKGVREPYTTALLSPSSLASGLDPSAPVSGLTYARLLDRYTQAVGDLTAQLQASEERGAQLLLQLAEVREAHTAATHALARLQDSGSVAGQVKSLRDALAAQQALVTRLGAEVEAREARLSDTRSVLRKRDQELDRAHEAIADLTERHAMDRTAWEDRERQLDTALSVLEQAKKQLEEQRVGSASFQRSMAGSAGSAMARAKRPGSGVLEPQSPAPPQPTQEDVTALQDRVNALEATLASVLALNSPPSRGLPPTGKSRQPVQVTAAPVQRGPVPMADPADVEAALSADLAELDALLARLPPGPPVTGQA